MGQVREKVLEEETGILVAVQKADRVGELVVDEVKVQDAKDEVTMKLAEKDRDFYSKHLGEAKAFQQKEFLDKIDVELYKAYYSADDNIQEQLAQDMSNDMETEWISNNKMFPATNRVTPTFYWQNPKIVFKPKRGTTQFASEIATAKINYDFRELGMKKVNQRIILDAWYSGFGGVKMGYTTRFKYKPEGKEGANIISRVKEVMTQDKRDKPDTSFREVDYIEYEGTWAKRLKPTNVLFDPREDVGEDKIIWLKFPKTLQDVMDSDMYSDIDKGFIKHYKGGKDPRDVNLELYEGWILTQNGPEIVVFCDGWVDALRYDKSSWKGDGFPMSFLSFAECPDTKYPPSFMKVAYRPQKQISYLSTLQGMIADKFRSQTAVNEQSLTPEGKQTLDANEFGGIVYFKGPIQGNVGDLTSSRIPPDLYQLIQDQQANLQEILQVSGLQLGSAEGQKTLGQDQLVEKGNMQGLTGIQDKVREFVMDEAHKMLQFLKQYATSEEFIPTVGMNIINPDTKQVITDEWISFGTEDNPQTLKEAITGDFGEEVDIRSAQQQNDLMKLQAAQNLIPQLKQMELDLAEEGEKVNMGKAARMILNLYKEILPEAEHIVERMSEEEKQQLDQRRQEMRAEGEQVAQEQKDAQALDNVGKAQQIRRTAEEPVVVEGAQ